VTGNKDVRNRTVQWEVGRSSGRNQGNRKSSGKKKGEHAASADEWRERGKWEGGEEFTTKIEDAELYANLKWRGW